MGVLTSDQESIEGCIIQFYKKLFTEHGAICPQPDVLNFPKISTDKAVRPFDEAEMFEVVKDFEGDKAPSLDGFPMILPDLLGSYQIRSFGNFSSLL